VDVAIVGAGPCGLSTALALHRSGLGLRVAVFERDAGLPFAPKGGSIQVSKPGWTALQNVDPDGAQKVRATGTPVLAVRVLSLDGARSVMPLPVRAALGLVARLLRLLRWLGFRRGEITRTHLWHDVRMALAERVEEVCGQGTIRTGLR
jgi:2-polyprenyl-6-methoxyphenol hydroxylase-like FAD-dependent oxidoreductase